jgi:transposase-like protein
VRYRSREVTIDGVRYRLRAQAAADGQIHVQVHRGGEPAGELAAPAEHLVALGQAVGELARAFGGRAWTVEGARQQHRAAYARWTEEEDARLAAEFAAGRSVEELAERFGRKPSAIVSRLRRLGLLG